MSDTLNKPNQQPSVRRSIRAPQLTGPKPRLSVTFGPSFIVFCAMCPFIIALAGILIINEFLEFDRYEIVKIDGIDGDEVSPTSVETWNVQVRSGLVIEMTKSTTMPFAHGATLCAAIYGSMLGKLTAEPATAEDCLTPVQRRSQ